MGRNKIIVVLSDKYDSLRAFAQQMAEGFHEMGWQVLQVDAGNTEVMRNAIYAFAGKGDTSALFFNQIGMALPIEGGKIIWNELDIDCYNYIVDHPMYYHIAITYPVRHLTFVCVDEYHQRFIKRFYPGGVQSVFLPLAGVCSHGETAPFEERSMDVLFMGGYTKDKGLKEHLAGLGKGLRQIWLECRMLLYERTYMTLEQGIEYCMKKRGLILEEDDLRDTVRLFADLDGVLRDYVRAKVIKTLADAGVKVHIYGGGDWDKIECRQENLVLHGRVPFDETIPLAADARIVLNVMPWFKAGAHDRIYTAMLNGGVCLTDSSEYLDRTLTDGKEALLYSLDSLEDLPGKVKYYLAHPKELARIAHRGYLYAKDTQTWQCRARQLAEIMEGNSDGR